MVCLLGILWVNKLMWKIEGRLSIKYFLALISCLIQLWQPYSELVTLTQDPKPGKVLHAEREKVILYIFTYWLWPWGTEWMSLSCPFQQWVSVHFSSCLSELLWGSEILKMWMQTTQPKKDYSQETGMLSVQVGMWRRWSWVLEYVRQRSKCQTTVLSVAFRALSSLSACLAQCRGRLSSVLQYRQGVEH